MSQVHAALGLRPARDQGSGHEDGRAAAALSAQRQHNQQIMEPSKGLGSAHGVAAPGLETGSGPLLLSRRFMHLRVPNCLCRQASRFFPIPPVIPSWLSVLALVR